MPTGLSNTHVLTVSTVVLRPRRDHGGVASVQYNCMRPACPSSKRASVSTLFVGTDRRGSLCPTTGGQPQIVGLRFDCKCSPRLRHMLIF